MSHTPLPSSEVAASNQDPVVVVTDEQSTGVPSSSPEPVGAAAPLSSSSQPGRGLPDEIIDLILAQDVLDPADHGRCTLVSRSFGKVAHDKLYDKATVVVTDAVAAPSPILGQVSTTTLDEWRRLARPNVRGSVRALCVAFMDDDELWHAEDEPREPTGIVLDRAALAEVVAELPLLQDVELIWAPSVHPTVVLDLGDLKNVRSLSMNRSQHAVVAAAPNLVRLAIPLYLEMFTPTTPPPRHLRKLCITSIDSRLILRELVGRLEWLAPPSLEVLEMPLASTSAALLLPFLERHVTRAHALREVKLDGERAPQWAPADRAALGKLGQENGFRVSGPGL
ncbi:uncharacterized protein RHOBADRAFT_21819 [Rhodotorula graminis WP1]|uniref:F-box domain-containing protein n=1 Tax=Rhodotorula graminis (strain WP1) TaxID=578459 RepID=A0A194S6C7_RHOGW|nr:uncharacterized protein RHOBADRAFT_21819 [Rhodotorula graminis WP1]KPV76099.1 hypothetical protein RHOBADRAFT_21819 [Rhodotorula graminis WP1]